MRSSPPKIQPAEFFKAANGAELSKCPYGLCFKYLHFSFDFYAGKKFSFVELYRFCPKMEIIWTVWELSQVLHGSILGPHRSCSGF